jgi:hypothetical protein
MKIDPKIPEEFYNMAIEEMPKEVINQWWEVPYIQTRGNYFAVLCLNGGAWDRPTLLGIYESIEEAEKSVIYD